MVLQVSEALSNSIVIFAIDDNYHCPKFHDWLLILPQEVKYIWCASWNWSKVLYLLTRYTPFAIIALVIRSESLFHWLARLPAHFLGEAHVTYVP